MEKTYKNEYMTIVFSFSQKTNDFYYVFILHYPISRRICNTFPVDFVNYYNQYKTTRRIINGINDKISDIKDKIATKCINDVANHFNDFFYKVHEKIYGY